MKDYENEFENIDERGFTEYAEPDIYPPENFGGTFDMDGAYIESDKYIPFDHGYNSEYQDFFPADVTTGETEIEKQTEDKKPKNIYGGLPYGAKSNRYSKRQNRYMNEQAYPENQNTGGFYEQKQQAAASFTPNAQSFYNNRNEVIYEKIGFFTRLLNILALIAGLGVLAAGVLYLLVENSIITTGTIDIFGIENINIGTLISVALQLFIAVIWLIVFRKTAKIMTLIFVIFTAGAFIFEFVAPDAFSAETSAILIFSLKTSALLTLALVCFAEQFLKGSRGLTVFLLLVNILSDTLLFIVVNGYIALPAALPVDVVKQVLTIVSIVIFGVVFMLMNFPWKKRRLAYKKIKKVRIRAKEQND